jgi:fructose-bisphosphate aldolase, class I
MGRKFRQNRLFSADGKCLDVAIDHGFFNEHSFLNGIEDMRKAVATIVEAMPDAIQLPPGTAPILQSIAGPNKPGLVLRTDVANIYGSELPRTLMSELIDDAVEEAIRLDAACVVVNLLLLPDQPELHRDCVRNVSRLKSAAEMAAMPLMIEPLVMQPNQSAGGYMVDGDIKKILPLVRQAVELGADIIKADPTEDVEEYHRVIEIASGVPVLVRGGGRAPDDVILERTFRVMSQGASGIVYGRNIIQHSDPKGMTKALMAVVHEGASPEQASAFIHP